MKEQLEQLILLRDLTAKTGILHEAQVQQLRLWPLMLTHATKVDLFFNPSEKIIIFELGQAKGPKPKDLKKNIHILSSWTKFLLGEHYKVSVLLDGKHLLKASNVRRKRKQISAGRK
jgi:hypothetical protein